MSPAVVFAPDATMYLWVPSSPLTVSFADGAIIGSIYLPAVPFTTTFAFTPAPSAGIAAYVANPDGSSNGPEVIPLPSGVTQAVLSATGSSLPSVYVYASVVPYNPFKGASTQLNAGNNSGALTVGADGTASKAVTFATPFLNNAYVTGSVNWGGTVPSSAAFFASQNVSTGGFTGYILGGSPGDVLSFDWNAQGN